VKSKAIAIQQDQRQNGRMITTVFAILALAFALVIAQARSARLSLISQPALPSLAALGPKVLCPKDHRSRTSSTILIVARAKVRNGLLRLVQAS